MNRRRCLILSGVVIAALLTGACGSSSTHDEARSSITVFNVSADPVANVPTTVAGHPVTLTSAQVRSALNELLSAHATLVATLMHQVGEGNEHPTAAIAALTKNTQSLTDAIAAIYGADGARAFAQLWEQHTQFFVDYARAERTNDHSAKTLALRRLLDYQRDFASFVSTATAHGASLIAVTDLLHTHVGDLTGYIDADTAGKVATARALLTRSVVHMHVIAGAIADAIAKQHLATVTR
jgi:hypothetical protein